MHVFADVLTSAHVWNRDQPLLTYSVPPEMQHELQSGQLIAVPYGDRLVEGIVWGVWEEEEEQGEDTTVHPYKGHPQDHQSSPPPRDSTQYPRRGDLRKGLRLVVRIVAHPAVRVGRYM